MPGGSLNASRRSLIFSLYTSARTPRPSKMRQQPRLTLVIPKPRSPASPINGLSIIPATVPMNDNTESVVAREPSCMPRFSSLLMIGCLHAEPAATSTTHSAVCGTMDETTWYEVVSHGQLLALHATHGSLLWSSRAPDASDDGA